MVKLAKNMSFYKGFSVIFGKDFEKGDSDKLQSGTFFLFGV